MVSRRSKFDHISDVIHEELHWLPIEQRIDFKTCILVYKCLHNMAPAYLAKHIISVEANASVTDCVLLCGVVC